MCVLGNLGFLFGLSENFARTHTFSWRPKACVWLPPSVVTDSSQMVPGWVYAEILSEVSVLFSPTLMSNSCQDTDTGLLGGCISYLTLGILQL